MYTNTCVNVIVIGNDNDDNNQRVFDLGRRRELGIRAYNKKRILDLLPRDYSKMRATAVYRLGMDRGIGPNTVRDYLKILREEGAIRRIGKPKEIYYHRCEGARLENLIEDFMEEMTTSLDAIPKEMSDIEKKLTEGSITKTEGEKAFEILSSEPAFLKSQIMNTLVRKVLKLLNDNLPEPLRGKDYYIGVFDEKPIRLVPRSVVEDKSVKS